MTDYTPTTQNLVYLIEWFCEKLQERTGKEVIYCEGYKPELYWLPVTYFSPQERKIWYCEVWLDHRCVFREAVQSSSKRWECIKRLWFSVFTTALFSSLDTLEKITNREQI